MGGALFKILRKIDLKTRMALAAGALVFATTIVLTGAVVVLDTVHDNPLSSAIFLGLITAPVAWWITKNQIEPLNKLRDQIKSFKNSKSYHYRASDYHVHEISELAAAFDELIKTHVAAEEELRLSAAELDAATSSSLDAFFMFHAVRNETGDIINFRFEYINAKAMALIERCNKDNVIGHLFTEIIPDVNGLSYVRKYASVVNTRVPLQEEFEVGIKGAKVKWLTHQIVPLADGVAVTARDITKTKELEKQLLAMARFDSLTGLPNRAQYDDEVKKAIARSQRNGTSMALMFLDIDNFKNINDTLGHRGGDDVLCQFAERLRSSVRVTDTVARLAGDEFVIIIEGLKQPEGCAVVAEKIIRIMQEPLIVEARQLLVTTSIGTVVRNPTETDPKKLLHKADTALYKAKQRGRNQFCSYDEILSIDQPTG